MYTSFQIDFEFCDWSCLLDRTQNRLFYNSSLCFIVNNVFSSNLGIKFLNEDSTDVREAKALKHALEHVCIYSNSWGPADTGAVMEHLSPVVKTSLSKGIHEVKINIYSRNIILLIT